MYSTAPADLDHKTLIGGEPYPSEEMQSVYSTAPADWSEQLQSAMSKFVAI